MGATPRGGTQGGSQAEFYDELSVGAYFHSTLTIS
jgi:hypothetical protein